MSALTNCICEDDEGFTPRGLGPYKARSCSDRRDDWPLWYVCGPDGRTNMLRHPEGRHATRREVAEVLARRWNEAGDY